MRVNGRVGRYVLQNEWAIGAGMERLIGVHVMTYFGFVEDPGALESKCPAVTLDSALRLNLHFAHLRVVLGGL